jgi:hypothetical protein
MERKRRAHQRRASTKCSSEAGVMQHPRFVGAKGSADVAEGPPEVRLSDSISKFCLVLCFFGTVMVAYSGYLVHAVWRGEFPTQMTDMVNCRPDGSVELQASVAGIPGEEVFEDLHDA